MHYRKKSTMQMECNFTCHCHGTRFYMVGCLAFCACPRISFLLIETAMGHNTAWVLVSWKKPGVAGYVDGVAGEQLRGSICARSDRRIASSTLHNDCLWEISHSCEPLSTLQPIVAPALGWRNEERPFVYTESAGKWFFQRPSIIGGFSE